MTQQTMVSKMNKGLFILAVLLLPGAALADGPVTPAGTSSSVAANVQGVTGGVPIAVTGSTGAINTIVPLDVSSVTTGGTAVTALATGHATAGGFLVTANAAGICVDQVTTAGTATGTPSTTTCVAQNQPFYLVRANHAVSVNSSASGVAFGGEGLQ